MWVGKEAARVCSDVSMPTSEGLKVKTASEQEDCEGTKAWKESRNAYVSQGRAGILSLFSSLFRYTQFLFVLRWSPRTH